jgi:hypothetical protein
MGLGVLAAFMIIYFIVAALQKGKVEL